MEDTGPEQKNGSAVLARTISQLNLPTLAAIFLMGGGNFLATKTTSEDQRQAVFRNIKEMHDALDGFENRQKSMLQNQSQMLHNQADMLERISKQHPPIE